MILFGYARQWWALDSDVPRRFSRDGAPAFERYAPNCFAASLESYQEIKLLYRHDDGKALATTADSSLVVYEDSHGLAFHATARGPFTDHAVREVSMGRARFMSIGFPSVEDFEYDFERGERIRTVTKCRHLFEISITPSPACKETWVRAAERLPLFMLSRRLDSLENRFAGAVVLP